MKVQSFIKDREVIQKILKYLGLWLLKSTASPKANVAYLPWRAPSVGDYIDNTHPQFPSCEDYNIDPEYPVNTYAL